MLPVQLKRFRFDAHSGSFQMRGEMDGFHVGVKNCSMGLFLYGNDLDLVGGFKQFLFSIIYINTWDVILPIDFHIFQDGYCTTNQ